MIFWIIINAIPCFFIGAVAGAVEEKWCRLPLMVFGPFLSAYLIYWIIVLYTGTDINDNVHSWRWIWITAWALPGYLALGLGYSVGKGDFEEKSNDNS